MTPALRDDVLYATISIATPASAVNVYFIFPFAIGHTHYSFMRHLHPLKFGVAADDDDKNDKRDTQQQNIRERKHSRTNELERIEQKIK